MCTTFFVFINQSADHVRAEPKILIRTDHRSMMIRCTTSTTQDGPPTDYRVDYNGEFVTNVSL